jgi:hypothetical protein
MIEFSELIPTMEHAMQGSVTFAAAAHGLDVVWKRVNQWFADRRYAKWEADFQAAELAAVAHVETAIADVKTDVETVKNKSKKNG